MKIIFCLMLLLSIAPAHAIDSESLADPVLQERYEVLIRELRCAKCQNANVADSPAEISGDFRRQIRTMLLEGKTDAEIKTFLTDRYGDFVLYRPPMAPRTVFVWFAPAIVLAGGLIAVLVVIRRRSLQPADDISIADTDAQHSNSGKNA